MFFNSQPKTTKETFLPSALRLLLCCLNLQFFSSFLPFALFPSFRSVCLPASAVTLGCHVSLRSQRPHGSQLSVIYSLISPSRSGLGLAPYGRELRWQLALYHSAEPGQVTHRHTRSEESTWTNSHTH